MHLYVVRHGETWANVEHRYLGSLDPALTERGKQQAQALEAQLPIHIDAIIVSPRLRAQQTADILNRGLHLQLQTLDCFRERDVGVFEGLTQAEAKDLHPHLWSQNITRQWDIGPTGGESIADVVMLVREGFLDWRKRSRQKLLYSLRTALLPRQFAPWPCRTFRIFTIGNFQMETCWSWRISKCRHAQLIRLKTRFRFHDSSICQ